MTSYPSQPPSHSQVAKQDTSTRVARPAWRQRLVDVERGMMLGVQADSIFFVYFFLTSLTLVASVVLGISLLQWTIVILSLTLVLCAEMFNQALKSLFRGLENSGGGAPVACLRMAKAAVFVAIAGSVIVIGLTLGQACLQMLKGG
jgi:diacylglycerol kinase